MPTTYMGDFVKHVGVNTTITVPVSVFEGLSDKLVELRRGWPKGSVDLLGAEENPEGVTSTHLIVGQARRTEDAFAVQVDLECENIRLARRLPARRRRVLEARTQAIRDILAVVHSLGLESHLHCVMRWEFPVGIVSTIVSLPLMRFAHPTIPFEVISGVRFASPSTDSTKSVILDTGPDQTLGVSAHFTYYDTISPKTVDAVIERGDELIGSLVTKREGGTQQ